GLLFRPPLQVLPSGLNGHDRASSPDCTRRPARARVGRGHGREPLPARRGSPGGGNAGRKSDCRLRRVEYRLVVRLLGDLGDVLAADDNALAIDHEGGTGVDPQVLDLDAVLLAEVAVAEI